MTVDLELGLVWDRDRRNFEINLRLTGPNGIDHIASRQSIELRPQELRGLVDDEERYAEALSEMLFSAADVRKYYDEAVKLRQEEPVHFRLHLGTEPAWLHDLRWESLRAPDGSGPITTKAGVLFSRYLSNEHWLPLSGSGGRGSALVVVAAPSDYADYNLHEVDRDDEIRRARKALDGYNIEVLPRASLDMLAARLNENSCEVLYLVAHGRLAGDVPSLAMENAEGRYEGVDARRLAEHIDGLDHKPRIAMLLSCQSANASGDRATRDGGVLAGLGPRLAGAGVPAVVAMQGPVRMVTAQRFAEEFFAALKYDDAVDRAAAKGRSVVRGEPDWWAPVLFSRLRFGRAGYVPQPQQKIEEAWADLVTKANRPSGITPVLGPGLSDGIVGSRAEIAQRWVHRWQLPVMAHGRGNLTQVAQYLTVEKGATETREALIDYLMSDLREQTEQPDEGNPFAGLEHLTEGRDPLPAIHEAGRRLRESDPDEPYRVASALNTPVFLTTGWADLLQNALRARGKNPLTMIYPWYRGAEPRDITGRDLRQWPQQPTVESPWVCHLFGRLDVPRSLVLTEDDYFTWLIAWIQRRNLPRFSTFTSALVDRPLLFVGYHLRDWDFKVLLRSIFALGGAKYDEQRRHVGVQLGTDSDEFLEPQAIQQYLETYLKKSEIDVFWSDTKEFFQQLNTRAGWR